MADIPLPPARMDGAGNIDYPTSPAARWKPSRMPSGATAGQYWTSNGPGADPSFTSPAATILRGYIGGLALSNDSVAPNTVLDIQSGQATSSDRTVSIVLAAALTKSISSTWAVGSGNGALDVGAVLASTWYHVYLINRTDTNVTDVLLSQAPSLSASVTATSASPAVFTWSGSLPFQNGTPVVLSGTTAPTGFTLGTTYYAVSVTPGGATSGTFSLAATQGGAAIASTSTGAGLIATSSPVLPANYTKSRRIGSILTNASSQIVTFTQTGDDFVLKTQVNNQSGVSLGTTPVYYAATVPTGVKVAAKIRAYFVSGVGQAVSLRSPDENAGAPQAVVGDANAIVSSASANMVLSNTDAIRTNLSQQVVGVSTLNSVTFNMATYGWADSRGRFD